MVASVLAALTLLPRGDTGLTARLLELEEPILLHQREGFSSPAKVAVFYNIFIRRRSRELALTIAQEQLEALRET